MGGLVLNMFQLLRSILIWVTLAGLASYISARPPIALLGCQDHCGNVEIPYPFGIGPTCFHDSAYEVICNTTSSSHYSQKAFLRQINLELLDINWPGRYTRREDYIREADFGNEQIVKVRTSALTLCSNDGATVNFTATPYSLSTYYNILMVENCGGSVVLMNSSGAILSGCASSCSDDVKMSNTSIPRNITHCFGIGCCQASISHQKLDFYKIGIDHRAETGASKGLHDSCTFVAALIDVHSVKNYAGRLSGSISVPTILTWNATYLLPHKYYDHFDNVSCWKDEGRQCFCQDNREGNPLLPNGCQVVPECQNCSDRCHFNYTNSYYFCDKKHRRPFKRASILGFTIGMGAVLFFLGCYWMYRLVKWRNEIKQKAKNFKRNGGLLLQQQMSSIDGVVEKTKVFAVIELKDATDNFNDNRILGQGGQGTVYKGMLADGRIVAVKKSKKVDESLLEQFINEVIILSKINHRNVVKLLGCCLETEVPLLVYEFISNGTLNQHIHDPSDDFHVTWKMRLQIAAESAGALAYLHSSSSSPIYHRDIKSANILLDEKYRAKVSDFGTSKAITIENTHITTCVQGTYGYLDPEYFQSNQFTEKSDVYSFGVVLVELLIGKKPIRPTEFGGWISLATEFLTHMENYAVINILDTRISDEGKEEEFTAVADLAKQCLNMNGKRRPTMKEVAMMLDEIRATSKPNS